MMTRRLARDTEWSFSRFSQFLEEGGKRAVEGGRKLCGDTWVRRRNSDEIQIDYYTTTILSFKRSRVIDLDMDGWSTTTTKERINCFSPLSVWVEKGQWYVAPNTSCFISKKQHLPIFLYDRHFARFYPDRRRSPTNAAGEPLLRRSVHERQCRLLKEADRRRVRCIAARYRKVRKYAAWILANTTLDHAFKDWTAEQRVEILEEVGAVVSAEKEAENQELHLQLRLAHGMVNKGNEEIVELEAKLANCTIDAVGHSAVVRERVIDL